MLRSATTNRGGDASRLSGSMRTLFAVGSLCGLTDGQLLERFLRGRGDAEAEAAFTALVERHGPMVLAVCRAVLGDRHDAEDACQAAFLVLARRAGTIRRGDSVASWLYGVARRLALRARRDAARRRALERRRLERTGSTEPAAAPPSEPWPELYEELDRLPEPFRAAVVLCDLEGHSYEQAARLAPLPGRDVAEPAGPGPRAAPPPPGAPRDRAGRRPGRLGRDDPCGAVAAVDGRDRPGGDRDRSGPDDRRRGPGGGRGDGGGRGQEAGHDPGGDDLDDARGGRVDGDRRDRAGGRRARRRSEGPGRPPRRRRPTPGRSTSAWSISTARRAPGIAVEVRGRDSAGAFLHDGCRRPRDDPARPPRRPGFPDRPTRARRDSPGAAPATRGRTGRPGPTTTRS